MAPDTVPVISGSPLGAHSLFSIKAKKQIMLDCHHCLRVSSLLYIYIYIYIVVYVCVCMCIYAYAYIYNVYVCVCVCNYISYITLWKISLFFKLTLGPPITQLSYS